MSPSPKTQRVSPQLCCKCSFDGWVRSIDAYSGPDLQYYNRKGIIPDSCVVKKGESRAQTFKEKHKFDLVSFADTNTEQQDEADVQIDESELAEMEG